MAAAVRTAAAGAVRRAAGRAMGLSGRAGGQAAGTWKVEVQGMAEIALELKDYGADVRGIVRGRRAPVAGHYCRTAK